MNFDDLSDDHRLIAYDLSDAFWQKLSGAMEYGFKEVMIEKDPKKRQALCSYYLKLSGVLQLKRMNLKLDCMKQTQTEYKVEFQP